MRIESLYTLKMLFDIHDMTYIFDFLRAEFAAKVKQCVLSFAQTH